MIIFDLDNTLFNTRMLKEDFQRIFEKYEICGQEFWKTFYQTYDLDPVIHGCYSIDKHLSILDFSSKTKEKIKNDLELMINQRGYDYLYPDVLPTLESLVKNHNNIVLVSKGDKDFQELKIETTSIGSYFNTIDIIESDKLPVIKKIIKDQPIIDINDNLEELKTVKRSFPDVISIFVRRHNQVIPKEQDVIPIADLSEISWYLRTLNLKS